MMAWIGCALRSSTTTEIQYSDAIISYKGDLTSTIEISFATIPLISTEKSCWMPLFLNPVIARGWPVPPRDNAEIGLEIPLQLMAELAGAYHAVEFEGGILMKGFSTILVPVECHNGSIQWHLIYNDTETSIQYSDAKSRCSNRMKLDKVDHKLLQTTRAFLGWWRTSTLNLGTKNVRYEDIRSSKASPAKTTMKVTGGSIGFTHFGSATLNYVLGQKDIRFHVARSGRLEQILDAADLLPICLYDIAEKRGWLVLASDLLLHITWTRHRTKPWLVDGNTVCLEAANTDSNGPRAARESILNMASTKLISNRNTGSEDYLLRDYIAETWSLMSCMLAKNQEHDAEPGVEIHNTRRCKIRGYEFLSLVHSESTLLKKETIIKHDHGGWLNILKKTSNLILFGEGFGEIIEPMIPTGRSMDTPQPSRMCPRYATLPRNEEFLATTGCVLNTLYSASSQSLSASELGLKKRNGAHEPCPNFTNLCSCSRLHQVVSLKKFIRESIWSFPNPETWQMCFILGQTTSNPSKSKLVDCNEERKSAESPIEGDELEPIATSNDFSSRENLSCSAKDVSIPESSSTSSLFTPIMLAEQQGYNISKGKNFQRVERALVTAPSLKLPARKAAMLMIPRSTTRNPKPLNYFHRGRSQQRYQEPSAVFLKWSLQDKVIARVREIPLTYLIFPNLR
jgi:hypothetical protein